MLLTNKIEVGKFTNNKDHGIIYKCKVEDYGFNNNCILFEVSHRQIGNLLQYDLDDDIIEYHITKQLSWLYCNNDTIINNIDVSLLIKY